MARLLGGAACACLALSPALWPGVALAQSGAEQPVYLNPDLSVPGAQTFGDPSGLYGRADSGGQGPGAGSQQNPGSGVYLGPSRSGEGQFFIYGESVQHVDESTGQAEKPSRKVGIKVNTKLNTR